MKLDPEKLFLENPDACYEKAEMDLLREALKKSYTERFLVMTRLMKIGRTLKKVKISNPSQHGSETGI